MVILPITDAPALFQRLNAAFELLLEGCECAHDAGQNEWEFAVDISDLQAAGLSKNAIRWLMHKGYVKFAQEVTEAFGKPGRQFRNVSNLVFPSLSCLVLTEAGVNCARQLRQPSGAVEVFTETSWLTATTSPPQGAQSPPPATPDWNADTRMLRVGDVVVKHFRVPAGNQELILSAFQEEGWPAKIDDPLPPAPNIASKRRLHDTINRLNRHQKRRLIRFLGNGNGLAVRWEYVKD